MDEWQQPAFTEGVKFLFAQVSAVLRARRERRRKAKEEPGLGGTVAGDLVVPAEIPDSLDGSLSNESLAVSQVEEVNDQLNSVYGKLQPYTDGREQVDLTDQDLLMLVEEARALMEKLYRQHLTFVGEINRPATGDPLSVVDQRQHKISAGKGSAIISGDNIGVVSITNDF